MKRSDFLKGAGLLGLSTVLPVAKAEAISGEINARTSCVLIPSETEGPFPLDLTENSTYFRQDVRETKTGVKLTLKMKILGLANCEAMQNVRVNIWACDKDGLYSGYSQTNNPGQAGLTYLRGWQMTDAGGEVEFTTIFPGWYTGRICHIHFQVYVSSVYRAVSQLTFPAETKNTLYAENTSLYTKGSDPMTVATDNIFSDGYNYQVATLTKNTDGSYNSYLEVTVDGSGSTGLMNYEGETGGQFKLKQNYPNPFSDNTTIPFTLTNAADVQIDLWDLAGKKVATINKPGMHAGEQEITVNLESLGLAKANYIYQLEVKNSNGTFRQCKMMTTLK
ncbi:MAG: T9SS type A sorting domain-containing protein [Bacteroidota bacterium]